MQSTARPDKNKGVEPVEDLVRTLAALERDLDRLGLFLAAYRRSAHPERGEALRWLLPVLSGRLATIRSGACAVEQPVEKQTPGTAS